MVNISCLTYGGFIIEKSIFRNNTSNLSRGNDIFNLPERHVKDALLKLNVINNSFEMIADWWGIKSVNQTELTQKLNQKYSILSTTQELKKKGFSLKQETLSNGTVRLVARKLGG